MPRTVIAEDAAVDLDRLGAIEDGHTRPTLAEVVRLAAVLTHYASDVDPGDALVDLATVAGFLPVMRCDTCPLAGGPQSDVRAGAVAVR